MRRALLLGLIVLLAGVGAYFGWRWYHDAYLPNKQVEDALDRQQALFESVRPELASVPRAAGFSQTRAAQEIHDEVLPDWLAELQAVNPDTVGWLRVEGGVIDYPIVQARDNEAYLRRGYDGEYNYVGCPFLDFRCAPDFGGFTSVVYAHYIPGRQEMFADVVKYKNPEYLRAHPTGTLLTRDGLREVRFFAYLSVASDSLLYETEPAAQAGNEISQTEQDAVPAGRDPAQAEQDTIQAWREAYIDGIFDNAKCTLESPGTSPAELKTGEPRLLLLSTCSYEYEDSRAVLVGVIE